MLQFPGPQVARPAGDATAAAAVAREASSDSAAAPQVPESALSSYPADLGIQPPNHAGLAPDSSGDRLSMTPQHLTSMIHERRQGSYKDGRADSRMDGRVRNPIPSKLKGKTDEKRGNFSVMHMDVNQIESTSTERMAAAKRISESTALQAKLAQKDGYVSHHRRANYDRPSRPPASAHSQSATGIDPRQPEPRPTRPLTAAEIKEEQARLLTLLRTLPHHTVVDQICKALAFFGGIPDAPPPADGKFPESAEANGSGSAFIGWLAEIFPDLSRPRRSIILQPVPIKRKRGRPKGSKTTKVRRDKGLKKGSQKEPRQGESSRGEHNEPEDSWIDVEESVFAANDGPVQTNDTVAAVDGPGALSQGSGPAGLSATTAKVPMKGFRSINNNDNGSNTNDSIDPAESSVRRRGRPKGSKNRPKTTTKASETSHQEAGAGSIGNDEQQTQALLPEPMSQISGISHEEEHSSITTSGRVNGQKSYQKTRVSNVQESFIDQHSAVPQSVTPVPRPSIATTGSGLSKNAGPGVVTSNLLSCTQKTTQPGHLVPASPENSSTSYAQGSPVAGDKRKRQIRRTDMTTVPTDDKASAQANNLYPDAEPSPGSQDNAADIRTPQMGPRLLESPEVAAPPPKRSRKSQDPITTTPPARQSTSNRFVASAGSPSLGGGVPESSRRSSRKSTAAEGPPPAEGLEAHYARFAAVQARSGQNQNQAYSNPSQNTQQRQVATSNDSNTKSTLPAEGLEAHYERFTAAVTQNGRQVSTSRQHKQQQQPQMAQPSSSGPEASNNPSVSGSVASPQQTRSQQNYYSQSQSLSTSYNNHQKYTATSRQTQALTNTSPGTALTQHPSRSPQFGAQRNSPLMQGENSFRASPSLVHSSSTFPPRRTPSASPLDANYRPAAAVSHGASNQSNYGGRQTTTPTTVATTTTNSSAHTALPFQAFPDSSFLGMQGLDPSGNHGAIGLSSGSYGMPGGGNVQQQRGSTGTAGTGPSTYAPAAAIASSSYDPAVNHSKSDLDNGGYLGPSAIERTSQNRWQS